MDNEYSGYPKNIMACLTGKPHRFEPRGSIEVRASAGYGTRKVYSCNDCLAVKVVFIVDDPNDMDGPGIESSTIVAPH